MSDPRDELIEALNAERDVLIRDRDRWAEEAQVNTSPIVVRLTADNARLRQRIQNQTDQINGLERSRRRLESLMAGADRRVEVVEAESARLRDALETCLTTMERADFADGWCCCGDDMLKHSSPVHCGHTPVDMGEYNASLAIKNARAALNAGKEPE
jgi:hypothetical protein